MTSTGLNISLEAHLVEKLLPLVHLLPPELADELKPYVTDPPSTIPYSLVSSVSRWTRSSSGQALLQSHTPALDAQTYAMVSLLAGSTTSPERRFPPHVQKNILAEEERKRQLSDKKAIVALLNAMLTVAGTGVTVWLAAERWKHEWRVLLSFLASVVVAASEVILYIIWQSRQSTTRRVPGHPLRLAESKKHDRDNEQPEGDTEMSTTLGRAPSRIPADGLRFRISKKGHS